MTCKEAMDAVLVADPGELAGEADGPLATHLRSCARCSRAARVILEDEGRLGSALSTRVAPANADRILELALHRASEEEVEEEAATAPGAADVRDGVRGGRFVAAGRLFIPLALAAGLAGLFLTREPELPGEPHVPRLDEAPGLNAVVPEGRSAAVFQTKNPDIKVIWLF